jgi:transposase
MSGKYCKFAFLIKRHKLQIKNNPMAKIYHVDLTEEERSYLTSIVNKRLSTSEAVKRSSILLAADRLGEKVWKDEQIATTYLVSIRTVERLRERFVNEGLNIALLGKPRLNLDKIVFDGEVESKLVALRCSEPVIGQDNWSLRILADKMVELSYVESISHESVRQILKKTKLNLGGLQNG